MKIFQGGPPGFFERILHPKFARGFGPLWQDFLPGVGDLEDGLGFTAGIFLVFWATPGLVRFLGMLCV